MHPGFFHFFATKGKIGAVVSFLIFILYLFVWYPLFFFIEEEDTCVILVVLRFWKQKNLAQYADRRAGELGGLPTTKTNVLV